MKQFFSKYGVWLFAAVIIAVVIAVIYYYGKKAGSGNPVIVDDSGNPVNFTQSQTDEANAIAQRINSDLNSGVLFGYNIWGNFGRDEAAYWSFANSSDTFFTLIYQRYKAVFKTSIIADIKAESSLPTGGLTGAGATYKDLILNKADRLKLI